MLEKRDRQGAVRCQCTVEETGIRYAGKVYRSLSSAAMAAAKDLGLSNKAQNGFTFWGLSKPLRVLSDPLVALARAWDRYRGVAESASSGGTDPGQRSKVRALIGKHAQALTTLRERVA